MRKEREQSVVVEPGGAASPPSNLEGAGFLRGRCVSVHLLSCAASAAMSVVILPFSFGKLSAGLLVTFLLFPDSQWKGLARKKKMSLRQGRKIICRVLGSGVLYSFVRSDVLIWFKHCRFVFFFLNG